MVESKPYEQLIGRIVGNYRMDQLMERHPWGPIFLASTQDGKKVLLRFLEPPSSMGRQDANTRLVYLGHFQQEANRVSSLQHPHILTLLDYGNYQGMPYLVYPSPSLVSLRAALSKGRPADLLTTGQFLQEISSTLEYAHQQGVLHRNLSTSSIFLYGGQEIMISEFGVLRMREIGYEAAQISTSGPDRYEGSSEGSAPEQLQSQPVDTYTDIYALGAVLYRLLTGQPPFSGPSREAIVEQHLYAEVPPLRRWRSDLPPELDQIIIKAMAKEPQQRFRRPSELTLAYYQIVAPDRAPAIGMASYNLAADATRTQRAASTQDRQLTVIKPPSGALSQRKPDPSRRRLITTFVSSATGIGVAAALLTLGPRFLHSNSTTGATTQAAPPAQAKATQPTATKATTKSAQTTSAKVLAHTTDVPLNSAKTFPIANQKNPGIIVHLPSNQFVAYDTTCTHAQCAVDYNTQDKLLECPCHGAAFDPAKQGAVVQPPAPTPLKQIKIAVNSDGTITAV
jgi:eukaryotic-like serine/threonine-protein kinase